MGSFDRGAPIRCVGGTSTEIRRARRAGGVVERVPGAHDVWAAGRRFGHYQIESLLATGGMADIWRAKVIGADGFEKPIVIKTMLGELRHRPELVAMFVNEAVVVAQLNHASVVQAFDFGQLEEQYYIAMEYVPGPTLRQAIKRLAACGRRLPLPVALHVMVDVCEALHHIHEYADAEGPLGLVHRDLSADNVIVSSSGTSKLLDFGAARATARTPPSPVFIGKVRYAAPERMRDLTEDRRSDIFSAGIVLYECLTGARPFEGSDNDIISAIANGETRDPRLRRPDLSATLAEITRWAMSSDPSARPASAHDLATELRAVLGELDGGSKEHEVTACVRAFEAAAGAMAPGRAAVPPTLRDDDDEDSGDGDVYELELFEHSGSMTC